MRQFDPQTSRSIYERSLNRQYGTSKNFFRLVCFAAYASVALLAVFILCITY